MHTKDILAAALREAGLAAMAEKAAAGYYHDYLSKLDTPSVQLATDLQMYANAPSWRRRPEAAALLARHLRGEFDASKEESVAWAQSDEGLASFEQLGRARAARRESEAPAPHTLGDAPIEEAYHAKMNAVAASLDEFFNDGAAGEARHTGFVLLVYPFGEAEGGRTNFISNGADRKDIVVLMKEMIARFEGQPEMSGRA